MNKKIPFITYLFFVLIYANQGFSGLPSQCIYYLTREKWLLTATQLGLITFITAFPWCIKPLWGFLIDFFPIKNYKAKYYLYINYILILLGCLYVIFFGLNIVSLLIVGFIMSCATGINDVANDSQMVILEKKYNLKGKIQSIQWASLGLAGLFVSIGGAWIAKTFTDPLNYKLAYGLCMILPIITLIYLKRYYKEKPIKVKKKISDLKGCLIHFKNKKFLWGLGFILCLQFSPSFGTALMIKLREELMVGKMFLGYAGALGTVIGLTGYGLYYWKAHKFPLKKLLYFAIIFSAITNLFYLYIPNKWFIIYYNLIFGAFSGITFLSVLAFMAKIVPNGYEGLFYAVITSINNFAGNLGGVFGGWIYDHFGYSSNVIIASLTTLLCLFFIPKLEIE